MIEQITGLPGAGKTLITLVRVKEMAEKDNRQVYYNGIQDLKLPWFELDKGEDWHKCPPGSIVVIDEAQRVFRPRGTGAQVPEHVEKLETHRHNGIDLYLITQHPMLLDSNVRRLVGRHIHTVRAFGAKFATLHEWPQVKENCDKSRAGSIEHKWFYPAKAFDWYKSAEVHTHKRSIPMRLIVLLFTPLVIAALVFGFYRWQTGTEARTRDAIKKSTGIDTAQGSAPGGGKAVSLRNYMESYAPRIAGLAYTAPAYDDSTKPVRAPYPAACVSWPGKGCRCYTSQATRLDVPRAMCEDIAATGFFVAWEEREREKPRERDKQAVAGSKPGEEGVRPPGGQIVAPAPLTLSESAKPTGGGSSTNPRFNPSL